MWEQKENDSKRWFEICVTKWKSRQKLWQLFGENLNVSSLRASLIKASMFTKWEACKNGSLKLFAKMKWCQVKK